MLKFEKRMEKTMEPDFSQNEPKLVLTYPHKSKFNTIGLLSCTDPKKLDQNLTIRRSVFLWQNIVLNSRRKLF